ncbi:hypothetical protein L6V77_29310 [Myxococcota bacterium]|nr:hypothetical protein [Myxococcota bacterium]
MKKHPTELTSILDALRTLNRSMSGCERDAACVVVSRELDRLSRGRTLQGATDDECADATQGVMERLLRPFRLDAGTEAEARAFLARALKRRRISDHRASWRHVPSGAAELDFALDGGFSSPERDLHHRRVAAAAQTALEKLISGRIGGTPKQAEAISRRARRFLEARGLTATGEVFPDGRSSAAAKQETRAIANALRRERSGGDLASTTETALLRALADLRGGRSDD